MHATNTSRLSQPENWLQLSKIGIKSNGESAVTDKKLIEHMKNTCSIETLLTAALELQAPTSKLILSKAGVFVALNPCPPPAQLKDTIEDLCKYTLNIVNRIAAGDKEPMAAQFSDTTLTAINNALDSVCTAKPQTIEITFQNTRYILLIPHAALITLIQTKLTGTAENEKAPAVIEKMEQAYDIITTAGANVLLSNAAGTTFKKGDHIEIDSSSSAKTYKAIHDKAKEQS